MKLILTCQKKRTGEKRRKTGPDDGRFKRGHNPHETVPTRRLSIKARDKRNAHEQTRLAGGHDRMKMEDYIRQAEAHYAERLAERTKHRMEQAALGRSFRQEAERLLLPVVEELNAYRRLKGELEFRLDCLCLRARGIWFGLLYARPPAHDDPRDALEDEIDLPGLELFVQSDMDARPLFLRIRRLRRGADYSSESGAALDLVSAGMLERVMRGIAEEITEAGL